MKQIIQTDFLYYYGSVVGFVGRDLKTNEISYYTYLNEFNEITDKLQKVDLKTCSLLVKQIVLDYRDEMIFLKRKVPKEIMWYVRTYLEKIKRFNLDHNLPITNLERNASYLNILSGGFSDTTAGAYVTPTNKIEMNGDKAKWKLYSRFEKQSIKEMLLHELGHMQVTLYPRELNSNILTINVGFEIDCFALEPLKVSNEVIFYRIINALDNDEKRNILEEMINEVNCQNLMPNYICSYPAFGMVINELCDNRLLLARHNHDFGVYNDSLTSIIPSTNMAQELLERICDYSKSNAEDRYEEKDKIIEMFKTYQGAKCKKLSKF